MVVVADGKYATRAKSVSLRTATTASTSTETRLAGGGLAGIH